MQAADPVANQNDISTVALLSGHPIWQHGSLAKPAEMF